MLREKKESNHFEQEYPLIFNCQGANLVGILHRCTKPSRRGVLVLVGGPQYRVGSHRQFVLLARYLAKKGVPVFRFDYRGMGDSQGDSKSFQQIDDDIRAAINTFFKEEPVLREVVIWGLCDAAFAASVYAEYDPRVSGLVLLNPWVRSEEGIARSYLKRYYLKRIFSIHLWTKILKGNFQSKQALGSFFSMLGDALGVDRLRIRKHGQISKKSKKVVVESSLLADRMLDSLKRFKGQLLFILSGNDLTAGEFKDTVVASKSWTKFFTSSRVKRQDLAEADHTFSRRAWRNQVSDWTLGWLRSW